MSIGVAGFEPTTSCSQSKRSTKLSYTPEWTRIVAEDSPYLPAMPAAPTLVTIAQTLRREVASLRFAPPVACVYNPLEYAWKPHKAYLLRYGDRYGHAGGRSGIDALFVGMNPGPFGMAQTGVPFGEVASVRDFLGIVEPVGRPDPEHPKRPVDGFACTRSEVSGARVWGWVRSRFGTPEAFFERFFIWNWCPLAFMLTTGANLTPDKLPPTERDPLRAACDRALLQVVRILEPRMVIGFGGFASACAERALGLNAPPVATVLHPSPASPAANRGWVPAVESELIRLGIALDRPVARPREDDKNYAPLSRGAGVHSTARRRGGAT